MNKDSGQAKKRQNIFLFHEERENKFFFTSVKDKCVCLICGTNVSVGKKCYVERHFTQVHGNFARDYPVGSRLRTDKVNELKATLKRQQSLFTKPTKVNVAIEASSKVAHILTKHNKPFTDGGDGEVSDDCDGRNVIQGP